MTTQSFKDLIVWQKSMQLVNEVYLITKNLPKMEVYGLSSQMRRAAISIPSNIAEGYKRGHRAEYIQFLKIAEASAAELETQLILAEQLYNYCETTNANSLLNEVQRLLFSIVRKLKT
jgi:four helix bundle protein